MLHFLKGKKEKILTESIVYRYLKTWIFKQIFFLYF